MADLLSRNLYTNLYVSFGGRWPFTPWMDRFSEKQHKAEGMLKERSDIQRCPKNIRKYLFSWICGFSELLVNQNDFLLLISVLSLGWAVWRWMANLVVNLKNWSYYYGDVSVLSDVISFRGSCLYPIFWKRKLKCQEVIWNTDDRNVECRDSENKDLMFEFSHALSGTWTYITGTTQLNSWDCYMSSHED